MGFVLEHSSLAKNRHGVPLNVQVKASNYFLLHSKALCLNGNKKILAKNRHKLRVSQKFAAKQIVILNKMKKQILNIGDALSKTEQKEVVGGFGVVPWICIEYVNCNTDDDCCDWQRCEFFQYGKPYKCN